MDYLEIINDRSAVHDIVNLTKILSVPGEITENTSLDFMFPSVEKPFESYIGTNVKLRYCYSKIDSKSIFSGSLQIFPSSCDYQTFFEFDLRT